MEIYVESIITQKEDDANQFSGLKRSWSFIKHWRNDNMGVQQLLK